MRCRHTVPDWHRYMAPGETSRPIFAACRLLVKEGQQASDTRSIACGYWGRQPACPVYDGPEAVSSTARRASHGGTDVPVGPEGVWPVRVPAAADRPRRLWLAIGGISLVVLGWAIVSAAASLRGEGMPARRLVALAGGAASSVALILTLMRLWVRG